MQDGREIPYKPGKLTGEDGHANGERRGVHQHGQLQAVGSSVDPPSFPTLGSILEFDLELERIFRKDYTAKKWDQRIITILIEMDPWMSLN